MVLGKDAMRKRVFIVCGGASLKDEPLGWLRKEDTIAVNYVGRYMPEPTYFLCADSGVIRNAVTNDFWGLPDTTGKVVVMQKQHPRFEKVRDCLNAFDQRIVPTRYDGDIGLLGGGTFATGKNSGFCALQYAVKLGYKEIYLLGVDLRLTNGRKYCYAEGGNPSPYDVFYDHFKRGVKKLQAFGIRIYSCSPVSRLNRDVPYVKLGSLVPKMPVFVSHYTVNTPYEQEVEHLRSSLEEYELDYDIQGIKSLGSWRLNSNYCATQIKEMMDTYSPRSILRLDADARVEAFPELFIKKGFRSDVAAAIWMQSRLRPKGELMGGTLYFGNTDKSRVVVDNWLERLKARPNSRNPDLLHLTVKELKGTFDFRELPLSYCRIFDFANMGPDKVIVHYQASRKFKKIVNQQSM